MPIVRTLGCYDCSRTWDITLEAHQLDDPLPECPFCRNQTHQEFKPVAIAGNAAVIRDKARKMAETIAVEDYGVADMNVKNRDGETPKVRYKNDTTATQWVQPDAGMIAAGAAAGRETRRRFGGDGLDVLQANIKNGTQPDLIEVSKRRSAKVW